MALMHVPFVNVNQDHLQGLIDSKSAETKLIEYKRESYGNKDADRAEFLADISSFANAMGGDLVIGMSSKAGVPIGFRPFAEDADAELLRLEQMARAGLEPRIPNMQTKAIRIGAEGSILLIRIPRSYRQPHRIIFQGRNRFWSRSSAGKFEPNVDELRVLFTFAPQLSEQMRQFRFDRVARIAAREGPVGLRESPSLALHIVPFAHFGTVGPFVSIKDIVRDARYFPPLGTNARADWRINFDGFVTLSNSRQGGEEQRGYVQIFQSGAIEAVTTSIANSGQYVNIMDIDRIVVDYVHLYIHTLCECGIEAPFAVMASLIGLSKVMFTAEAQSATGQIERQLSDRDQFHFTEVIFEEVPATKQECAVILHPILDQLANAAGCVSAESFDSLNNYIF